MMTKDNIYRKLLKECCDGLISLQITGTDKAFRGGFLCRACKMIHGRSPDAVYPLSVMYKLTGERKYLEAADLCFDYGENLLCKDGALYNDAQAGWRYTTVFHNIAVLETLHSLGNRLPENMRKKFAARSEGMTRWLYENLDENSPPNINYVTTNALSLELAGLAFGEEKYRERAAHLAEYALRHFSENGLFYGESKNHDAVSPLGCRAVDIGYDLEESVPALVKYAKAAGNEKMLAFLSEQLRKMTEFILPDGGLDNSFGCRNNKWTYYGSRTSDGISPAYLLLADRDPVFAEAAYRNTRLQQQCTADGLLCGGPDYRKHGEYPCTHHTFEHANAIAFAVDCIPEKYLVSQGVELPSERSDFYRYYPEVNTFKFTRGNYSATITGYDFDVPFSGHASGGTLSMLYGKNVGPMIAASVTDYVLVEPTNMQQPLDIEHHRSLVPRLEAERDGEKYASSRFVLPKMTAEVTEEHVRIKVETGLSARDGKSLSVKPRVEYMLDAVGMRVSVTGAEGMKFVLPLISGRVCIQKGALVKKEQIFFLTGGFIAEEYTIVPDRGEMEFDIKE